MSDPTDAIPTEVLGDLIAAHPERRRHQPTLLLPEATPAGVLPILEEIAAVCATAGCAAPTGRRGLATLAVDGAPPDALDRQELVIAAAALVMAVERIDQAARLLLRTLPNLDAGAPPCDQEH